MNLQYIVVASLFLFSGLIFPQLEDQISVTGESEWKGFVRGNNDLGGRNAFVTRPKKALKGNPWVWNAGFPDWYIEMDSILVAEDFHVAHVDTADFIKYHSKLSKTRLSSVVYHELRSGLINSFIQFEKNKTGRVAFLGGSITYNSGWRDSVCNYLTKRFPKTKFEFIAAGIPSQGTTPAAFRMERDVLSKGLVDLLFEEAAVNDSSNERTDIEQVRAMEGIVRHAKKVNPAMDIVIMHFVDPEKMETYRSGKEPSVITNHEMVADHYGIPTINLAKEVTDRIDNGEFTWEDDFKNLHPSPFGQGVYASSIIGLLDRAYASHLDADDKMIARTLPKKIDPNCYDNGILADMDISDLGRIKKWKLTPFWKPRDSAETRSNFVEVPMLEANSPGSSLKYGFEGRAVGIAVATGPDAGSIEYRVDKGKWRQLNLFTKWSKHIHLPWYFTLADELGNGRHKLEIRIAGHKDSRSTGNACRIRYFYINR